MKQTCPNCKGTGRRKVDFWEDCRECNGTGSIESPAGDEERKALFTEKELQDFVKETLNDPELKVSIQEIIDEEIRKATAQKDKRIAELEEQLKKDNDYLKYIVEEQRQELYKLDTALAKTQFDFTKQLREKEEEIKRLGEVITSKDPVELPKSKWQERLEQVQEPQRKAQELRNRPNP